MLDHMLFDMKKWFSPNGMVINADGLDYQALPERIRIAKGTKIAVVYGQIRDGEETGSDAWLQADVTGKAYGFTRATNINGISENSSFMFTLDEDYLDRVGLLKDEQGENIFDFSGLKVDCDKCQIISGNKVSL